MCVPYTPLTCSYCGKGFIKLFRNAYFETPDKIFAFCDKSCSTKYALKILSEEFNNAESSDESSSDESISIDSEVLDDVADALLMMIDSEIEDSDSD